MYSRRFRSLLWQKLGQSVPQSNVATNSTPPPAFQASSAYGWLNSQYNSYTIITLNSLISLLNVALHYSSNGQYNFQILKNNNFQVDPGSAPSLDTKNLILLSMLMFKTFLNNGNNFPDKPNTQQIQSWIAQINNSQALLNLSQVNPTGNIAIKISPNLKEDIINFLRYISMYNSI